MARLSGTLSHISQADYCDWLSVFLKPKSDICFLTLFYNPSIRGFRPPYFSGSLHKYGVITPCFCASFMRRREGRQTTNQPELRLHDDGRAFYTASGHDHRTWTHPR
jgi:hypothetical protein